MFVKYYIHKYTCIHNILMIKYHIMIEMDNSDTEVHKNEPKNRTFSAIPKHTMNKK